MLAETVHVQVGGIAAGDSEPSPTMLRGTKSDRCGFGFRYGKSNDRSVDSTIRVEHPSQWFIWDGAPIDQAHFIPLAPDLPVRPIVPVAVFRKSENDAAS